ncbi:endoribonuclease l-psp [Chaetoceros tenuissimus]|uniref:Endoribonuclease l-psp n=1 Tax=Chaetoceros tenuissimus TaxID=426638 RepID=A0AAD3CIT9_9STRA|nr:endoribonuclease l-psp [Chaetoceros tenuissimus]
MGKIEEKLEGMGIEIPTVTPSQGNYVSAVKMGNALHLCGHIPMTKDGLLKGKLGSTYTVEQGYESAKACAINILATLKSELGTLDRVKQVVKVVGFVACTDDFEQQPAVINGASDFFVEVFGEKGRHARSAVGTNSLPLGIATEVECIIEFE